VGCLWAQSVVGSARAAAPPSVSAALTLSAGAKAVPRSFFGLSIEYKELADYELEGPLFDRVLSLIRPQGGGPMILRIGGKSADHVYWQGTTATPPQWVSFIQSQWLSDLDQLITRANLKVMLDLNLAVHSPALEASFASAAVKAMPGRLVGLEVGNEPDLYWRQPWLEKQQIPGTQAPANWAQAYSPADYRRDYTAYAQALSVAAHGVPLGGPEIISAKPSWLQSVEGLGHLSPSFLTIHRYASSTCWPHTSPYYPTLHLMLSDSTSAGLARTVEPAVSFAHAHHQHLLVDEINSISCGGNIGVANSFATALWAPDTLFSMLSAGVDGVNWHLRPGTLNAPFIASPTVIAPNPELYGLAAFAQMLAPGATLLNTTLTGTGATQLKGWVVHFTGGTRVLLINKGAATANVALNLNSSAPAFVRRLLAPSISSATGVTFGGQTIGHDARWHGKLKAPAVPNHDGVYSLTVPGYSAAMVSIWG
jgi:hypothetical protein